MLAMNDLWILPEALAWCIWREEEAVKRAAESRIGCMGLLSAAITEAGDDTSKSQFAFAMRNELHSALYSGTLKAVGTRKGALTSCEIPAAEWRCVDEFKIFIEGTGPSDVGRINDRGDHEVVYTHVTVYKCDVQKQWPQLPASPPPRKVAAGPEVKKFLEKVIAERGGFISQDEACKITQAEFPNVGRDSIRALSRQLTGNDKRGRPTKRQ